MQQVGQFMGAVRHGCSYMIGAFKYDELLGNARRILAGIDFDTIVGTGLSGTIAGAILAHGLNKNLLIIRKAGDQSHSFAQAEGFLGLRWIFVDDLISSGDTRARCKYIVSILDTTTEYVGTYTYGDNFGTVPMWRDYVGEA